MFRNGALYIHRLMAFLLMLTMVMTAVCPALAADIWQETVLNILWTDDLGETHIVPATPVANSLDRAYWVSLDTAALEKTLILSAECPDPDYTFFLEDEWGGQTDSFIWYSEMDARNFDYTYAHILFYAVDGVRADSPILLYLSSQPMPEETVPESYPVEIPVYYVTEDGVMLDTQYVECWTGETNTIWASSRKTADYALIGADTADVYVDANGAASPSEVTFVYRQLATPTPEPTDVPTPTPVAEVSVPVVYVHLNGRQLDFQEHFLAPGTHTVYAQSGKTDGYVPVGDTAVQITVYPDGTMDLASVTFYYDDPAPAEAVIPVYYYHADGTLLDMQEKTLAPGRHTIQADSAKVDGLVLEGVATVEVTVYEDGTADKGYVAFTYATPVREPVKVSVAVKYIHVEKGILDTQDVILTEGSQIVYAQSDKTADYLPVGSTSVEVTVYPDGSIHPESIEFYYEDAYAAPVAATVEVYYSLPDNTVVARDYVSLTPGRHTIWADPSKTGGYPLVGEQSQAVEVYENGMYSPDAPVSFTVRYPDVSIMVHYQDDMGRAVAPDQKHIYSEDGEYLIEARPEGLDENYELAPGLHTQVLVTIRNGVPSQNDVYFYYQQKQSAPSMANVTVHYYDTKGNEIAPAKTITLEPGTHFLEADPDNLPEGYELALDEAIKVEVYENGTFSPQEVAFYYRPTDEKKAAITIHFRDDRGNSVATSQTVKLGDGKHILQAQPDDLPEGYVIFEGTGATAEVTVRNGVASKNQVVFYYQQTNIPVKEFKLPVNYYDTEGKKIASTQYVKVPVGSYSITANPTDLPAGYELAMKEKLPVTVFADGTTDPEEIAFYYKPPQKMATIIVSYVDERKQLITDPFTMELSTGFHTIQADPERVPAGYDPQSAKPAQVYVSREGAAEPDQVTLSFTRQVVETPIPVGADVNRYANVNSGDVAFRNEPTTSGGNKTVIKRLNKNSKVFVHKELYNDKNEVWAMVNVDGRIGYMMSSFLDILTQQKSDDYSAGSTMVPTFTPVPTPTEAPTPTATPTQEPVEEITPPLVERFTPEPSETPTLEPLPEESASPTPTASPEPYVGYALTTRATALRTGISASDMTVIQILEANELVRVADQVADHMTGEMWAIVSTLSGQPGYVQYSALREITDREAAPYIEYWKEVNKTPDPTSLATATPEPPQVSGYGVVIGDGVPFRQMQSEFSRIIDHLAEGTVVYVTGQTGGDGQYWHSVNHENRWGYIRTDLVRMMTIAEEEAYLESQRVTPTPATTNLPFDASGMSSYGYVDASSVNWRENASTGAKKVGELKRYAFCLVLGSEHVNGVTWYQVSYGDKTGYIHGDFFKQMTISELEDFLGSEEYVQGVVNNSPSSEAKDDVGYTGTGGIVSAEDQWINSNPDVYASFAPFNPIGTVAPIATGAPTLEPLPGWLQPTEQPTATPTPTPTFNPLPDVTYPITDDGDGGAGILWALVIGLLVLAVGGVFALVRYNQNRRRIAMRAAQRRAQAARAQQQQQRPYARTTNPPQARTGMYQQQTTVRRSINVPVTQEMPGQHANYAENGYTSSFRRPAEEQITETTADSPQRVGRRTAYRQAQEAARMVQEKDENLNM